MDDLTNNIDTADLSNKINYLENILNRERDRDKVIEGKLSQVRSQSSIIVALTGLYLPILKSMSIGDFDWITYATFVVVPLNLILFGVSILLSRKSLDVSKYNYAVQDEDLVTEKSGDSFMSEQIDDLLFIIKENRKITNRKGTNLIWSHKAFYFGLVGTFILTLLFIFNLIPII